jgi:hypothetical protein
MPKREIDLNGIDWTGLDTGDVSLEKMLRLPPRHYRLHQWSDEVALKKRLGRWEVAERKELERLAIIRAEKEKLMKRLEELKENSEFSQGEKNG